MTQSIAANGRPANAIVPSAAGQNGNARVSAIPFRKATLKKRTLLTSYQAGAALGGRNSWEIDSKGYLGGLRLLVSGQETTSTADPVVTANGDWPWNLFQRINLRDSSGGMLVNLKGYSAYLAERYFKPIRDPAQSGGISQTVWNVGLSPVATNEIRFHVDVEVETGTRDNLGLVPNQNATFRYQLTVDFEQEVNLVGTPANSTWALQVQPSYRYYSVPSPVRPDNVPQQNVPPFVGVVRQQFDETQVVPSLAENRYNLAVGRVIRNIVLVTRNASGIRVNGISRVRFMYGDDTVLFEATEQDIKTEMIQQYGTGQGAIPLGVYVLPFSWDNDAYVGADYRRDLVDTRRLSQCYMLITTKTPTTFENEAVAGSAPTTIDILHDELIVPARMSI